MAQRIRSCTNNTKVDPLHHCNSHINKTGKRPQSASATVHKQNCPQKCSRDQTDNRGALVPTISSSLKSKSGTIRQQNLANSPNLIRKDLVADNSALVEVTVRTHTSRRSHNNDPKSNSNLQQPWGKLLKAKKSDNVSSFNDFDPLRTLHFLAKELQSKLKRNGVGKSKPIWLKLVFKI